MNITLNGNVYDVDRITRIACEGTRIKVESQHLTELGTAPQHKEGNFMCVVAQGKTEYRVLVKPATAINEDTVIYLLSKIVLKKCLKDAQYVPTYVHMATPYRERTQEYGSQRSQGNDRPRTWNR